MDERSYHGITFDPKRRSWKARIHYAGKEHYIGRFNSPLEAALAYDQAARMVNAVDHTSTQPKSRRRPLNFPNKSHHDNDSELEARLQVLLRVPESGTDDASDHGGESDSPSRSASPGDTPSRAAAAAAAAADAQQGGAGAQGGAERDTALATADGSPGSGQAAPADAVTAGQHNSNLAYHHQQQQQQQRWLQLPPFKRSSDHLLTPPLQPHQQQQQQQQQPSQLHAAAKRPALPLQRDSTAPTALGSDSGLAGVATRTEITTQPHGVPWVFNTPAAAAPDSMQPVFPGLAPPQLGIIDPFMPLAPPYTHTNSRLAGLPPSALHMTHHYHHYQQQQQQQSMVLGQELHVAGGGVHQQLTVDLQQQQQQQQQQHPLAGVQRMHGEQSYMQQDWQGHGNHLGQHFQQQQQQQQQYSWDSEVEQDEPPARVQFHFPWLTHTSTTLQPPTLLPLPACMPDPLLPGTAALQPSSSQAPQAAPGGDSDGGRVGAWGGISSSAAAAAAGGGGLLSAVSSRAELLQVTNTCLHSLLDMRLAILMLPEQDSVLQGAQAHLLAQCQQQQASVSGVGSSSSPEPRSASHWPSAAATPQVASTVSAVLERFLQLLGDAAAASQGLTDAASERAFVLKALNQLQQALSALQRIEAAAGVHDPASGVRSCLVEWVGNNLGLPPHTSINQAVSMLVASL